MGAGDPRDVQVRRRNGSAVIEIADDGVGGADETAGSGLRGLADRVAALDGTLKISSPPGPGTVVTAELPCGTWALRKRAAKCSSSVLTTRAGGGRKLLP